MKFGWRIGLAGFVGLGWTIGSAEFGLMKAFVAGLKGEGAGRSEVRIQK